MQKYILFLCLFVATAGSLIRCTTETPPPLVICLFRHAETVTPLYEEGPRDPVLNQSGQARAIRLAQTLHSVPIDRIFSSDYKRTRATVGPLSAQQGKEVEIYDPRNLEAFAEQLKSMQGHVAVSGHSNTTPELVKLLGGDPGDPIDEKVEFDRLYVLVFGAGRRTKAGTSGGKTGVQTMLLHYGSN